jgi:outer membrane lipase/esterase
MRQRLVLFALVMAAGTEPAGAQSFNQFIGFGDSTIDSGFYKALSSPGSTATFNGLWLNGVANGAGAPTTSPGLMNAQVLANYFGLSALPANQPGGTNFATSGAKDKTFNTAATGGFGAAIPTVVQIQNYLAATNGVANGNALYLISSGGNDVTFALGQSGTGPFPANPSAYLVGAANDLSTAVASLRAAGARYFVVPDLPYSFPGNDATERAARLLYSQALWSDLAAAGVNFVPADFNAVRLAIAANPASFGFQSISNAPGNTACTVPFVGATAWALLCSSNPAAPSHFVTANADQTFLFADDQHLTTAGQRIQADYMYSLIVAPSEISYLAEVPVKTRAAVVNAIDSQIPLSQNQQGPYHAWVSGDVSWLKMNNANPGFPDDPGTPLATTAGFDFKLSPNWLAGLAFSGGRTKQTFSLGGDFTLDEFAVSAYAAYLNGPFWGNAIASGGGLFFDTNRQVPIGVTVQPNTGSTKGTNFSLMLETGYNFTNRFGSATAAMPIKAAPAGLTFTHGPVVGLTLQQVRVNGFTETDQFAAVGGFTALSFLSQTRNSAVSELGYQASVDLGMWRPFGKVVWNHELADTDRQVTAFLTSASFAPGYSLPAVTFGKDWGTAQLGTSVKLARDVTAFAAFNSQFAEQNVTTYGGQVGVNIAFDPDVRAKN